MCRQPDDEKRVRVAIFSHCPRFFAYGRNAPAPMRYTIEVLPGYIKAEMLERDSAEETSEFVDAILKALGQQELRKLLISIRSSRPVFKVSEWNLSGALDKVMPMHGLKVAFISDTKELAMSQQYIELLAKQRGLAFRTFSSEKAASQWLRGDEG